jgi:hypothetical protein
MARSSWSHPISSNIITMVYVAEILLKRAAVRLRVRGVPVVNLLFLIYTNGIDLLLLVLTSCSSSFCFCMGL